MSHPTVTLLRLLFFGSLAYWNYRRAKRNGTWAWSRLFILIGAIVVLACAFLLPLGMANAMHTHSNRTFGIMVAGTVVFVSALFYLFTKYPAKPRGQVAATPSSTSSTSDGGRASMVAFTLLCALGGVAQTPAHAQSLYKDPAGAFTVMVPANWQTQQAPGSPMVSFVNEKSQASVSMGVIHGDKATTPSADKELEMVQTQFPENCPQAKIQKRGPTTLGGISGVFLLANCTNDKGGLEVMKFAVASQPGLILLLNSASPAPNYAAVLPAFNSMEHSLKLGSRSARLRSSSNRSRTASRSAI